jgi:hypothetical protein
MIELDRLLGQQASMVARRQLNALGLDADHVQAQVAARRWVVRTPRVVSTTTGELTWEQRCWLGVLHAGPRSMLGALTAAGRLGLTGWERGSVTVLVDDELAFEPVTGVRFFRSRRPFDVLRSTRLGLATSQLEPAILLWAAYDAPVRAAHGVLAACVQQRLTTSERLATWVDILKPLRRAAGFRRTIRDIAGGAHSGAELDVRRMCRRFGLSLPHHQRPRFDRAGKRRWTDCEWDLPGGGVLVLEVDGGFHREVVEWGADLKRARGLTARDRLVVRCTAFELRHEEDEVARDLIALGVPRLVA